MREIMAFWYVQNNTKICTENKRKTWISVQFLIFWFVFSLFLLFYFPKSLYLQCFRNGINNNGLSDIQRTDVSDGLF